MSGAISSAGKSFSASAPAASAAKPSVGVQMPSVQARPADFAARITAGSARGITMIRGGVLREAARDGDAPEAGDRRVGDGARARSIQPRVLPIIPAAIA